MAAVLIAPLEAALLALLAALGVGAGAVVIDEELRRRQRAVADAGSGVAARTASQARPKRCEPCPPDCGELVERRWNMSAAAREYQARVSGFAPFTEWSFGGIDFDGFASDGCVLKEAKSRYDQFLTEGEDGELLPRQWYLDFEAAMLPQARRQADTAAAAPPTRLIWYFQGPKAHAYMARKVMAFRPLVAVHMP